MTGKKRRIFQKYEKILFSELFHGQSFEIMSREEYDHVLKKAVLDTLAGLRAEKRIAAVVLVFGIPLKVGKTFSSRKNSWDFPARQTAVSRVFGGASRGCGALRGGRSARSAGRVYRGTKGERHRAVW